jgi:hypothetical protein
MPLARLNARCVPLQGFPLTQTEETRRLTLVSMPRRDKLSGAMPLCHAGDAKSRDTHKAAIKDRLQLAMPALQTREPTFRNMAVPRRVGGSASARDGRCPCGRQTAGFDLPDMSSGLEAGAVDKTLDRMSRGGPPDFDRRPWISSGYEQIPAWR